MAGFVLIHGAFHGGWCFDPVVERLRARGHDVVAPTLPGMGGSEAELRAATHESWARFVAGLCRDMRTRSDGPVVLVGHSRGGSTISATAEHDPYAMDALVYLTAMLAPVGPGLAEAMETMPGRDAMMGAMQPVENGAGMVVAREAGRRHFLSASPAAETEAALDRLVAEPMETFVTPVVVSHERWGSLPRTYIECTNDNSLHITFQRTMIALSPGTEVMSLDADHSPFYSAPDALTGALERIAAAL